MKPIQLKFVSGIRRTLSLSVKVAGIWLWRWVPVLC